MLRLLTDENFNGDIIRGLRLRRSEIDLVRVQDLPITGADDATVLEWAAQNNRILLTHDRTTIPAYAVDRLEAGQPMTGVFILNDRFPVGRAIEEVLIVYQCSETEEWNGLVIYLPL